MKWLSLVGLLVACLFLPDLSRAGQDPPVSLARIAIRSPADVGRVEKAGIPVLAHLSTPGEEYLLAVLSPAKVAHLRSAGLDVVVLDPDAADAAYYLVPSESIFPVKEAVGDVSVVYDDGVHAVARAPATREPLPRPGLDAAVVRLGPEPIVLARPASGNVPSELAFDPLIADLLGQITVDGLQTHIGGLSGEWPITVDGGEYTLSTRHSYSGEPIAKATQYVRDFMHERGFDSGFHTYVLSGHSLRNVIGEKLGTRYPDQIALLTAHLDSRAAAAPHDPAPGADDNGSGSAALLTVAGLIADLEFEYTVRIVFFTGEEQGMYGSDAYAQHMLDAGEEILGVVNLDMIAWDATGGPDIDLHSNEPTVEDDSDALADLFAEVVDLYGLSLAPQVVEAGHTFSDHYRFWQRGYPAIMAIEDYYNPDEAPEEPRDWNTNYHTGNDRLATLNLTYLREYSRAALGTILHLARPVRRIEGQVTSAQSGLPLTATVRATGGAGAFETAAAATGMYSLPVPGGTYSVTASAYGFAPATHVDVDASTGAGATVSFALSPLPSYAVSGTLQQEGTGKPLTGTVRFGGGPVVHAVGGTYSTLVPSGTHAALASAPFHYSEERMVTVDGDQQQHFALAQTPCLLVVDDDFDTDGNAHDDQAYYTTALDDLAIEHDLFVVGDDENGPSADILRRYRGVVWLTGRDWDQTLTAVDQDSLADYLESGGRAFVSGQDIGWDLAHEGSPPAFYADYLHATYLADESDYVELSGSGWMAGVDLTITGGDGANNQEYPSVISPAGNSQSILRYPDEQSGAVAFGNDTYRVVYFAFGFEGINSREDRRDVMERVLEYLGPCPATHEISGTISDVSTGQPISGTVQVGSDLIIEAVSGHYRVEVESGTYELEARARFHYPGAATVLVEGDLRLDFALTPTPCVLVVDDDHDSEGNVFEDQAYYTSALADLGIETSVWAVNDDQDGPPANVLELYRSVVWLTGRDWDGTLTVADQNALASYLDGGGRLFVSGQDIGWDLAHEEPVAPFYPAYLHARYLLDDSGYREVFGDAWMEGLDLRIQSGDGANNQEYPSDIDVEEGAAGIFHYEDGDWAATAFAGDVYRVVYFAFGFEAIDSRPGRRETMRRVIEFLQPCEVPDLNAQAFLPLVQW